MNKIHVLFLYASKGVAETCLTNEWLFMKAGKKYEHNAQDGYFILLKKLLDSGVIDELTTVYESNISPGVAKFVAGAENYVIPRLTSQIMDFLVKNNTIIFVRGGFKHWAELLLPFKGRNWLMVYAANTGRDKWPWWDIVCDDLLIQNKVDRHGRYMFPFIKPINEEIFHYKENESEWDVCIGASAIHDKKGQWKTIELLDAFEKETGRKLNCVMPGGLRKGTKTNEMVQKDYFKKRVLMAGNISRPELADIFSKSSVFLHLGPGGQNDRSAIEAFACGVPFGISNIDRFSPVLLHSYFSYFYDKSNPIGQWVRIFEYMLDESKYLASSISERREQIADDFKKKMGLNEVIVPMFTALMDNLRLFKPTLKSKKSVAADIACCQDLLYR